MREGWRAVRLGEVLALDVEPVIVSPETEYRLAGVYSFGRGLFRRDPLLGARTSYKQLHRLGKGQLVLSKLKAWEGAVAVVGEGFDGFVLSPEFPTFSITGALEPEYLSLLCRQSVFWERLRLESRGVGGRRERVHPRRLLEVAIGLPPLADQRRIVDLVWSSDLVIGSARHVASSSTVAAARVRGEHFSERSTTTPAGEFFEITMGRQRSPRHASGDHVVRYLRAANAKDGRLDLSDVKAMNFSPTEQSKYRLEDGDVLVTEGCGSLEQLGASAQWHAELSGVVCFQNTLIRLRGIESRSLSNYAFQWARWCFEAGRFAAVSSGTNIFHVGAERVRAMAAPDTTLAEQGEFLQRVEALDSVASHARAVAERATELRHALVSELLAGNHEIPDSYDALLEPAS